MASVGEVKAILANANQLIGEGYGALEQATEMIGAAIESFQNAGGLIAQAVEGSGHEECSSAQASVVKAEADARAMIDMKDNAQTAAMVAQEHAQNYINFA